VSISGLHVRLFLNETAVALPPAGRLDDCNATETVISRDQHDRPQPFRFVRYLPGARDRSERYTDLRAGVGQASREEAAANVVMLVEGYGDSTGWCR
jgi:hypothetical protein